MNDYSEIKDFIERPLQLINSKALVKSPQLLEKVREIFERINETLENNLFNYHRSCIGGSCGKETALSDTFDLDIIVFVDIEGDITVENYIKQRESTLKRLEKIILQNLYVTKLDKPTSNYSFSFTFKDIDVDLVVALNRLGPDEEGAIDAVDRQHDKIFDLIHDDRINEPYFNANELNSSITETIVKFYINQSEFVKNFIILCKYWLHLYCTDVHFGGKSSTIELIAIDVGNRMENQGDLAAAFKSFIRKLMSINKIRISFCSRLNDDRLEQRFVEHKPPFLKDPQNPYNNRLKRLKYKEKRDIQLIAKETMQQIELHENTGPTNYPYNFILILLLYISFIVFGMLNTDGGMRNESLPVSRPSLINGTITQIQNEVRYHAADGQHYLSITYRLASIIENLNRTYSIKNRASDCTVFENIFLACQFHETYYFMKLKSMYLIDAMIAVDNLDCSFMEPEFQASLAPHLSDVTGYLFLWKEYLSLDFYKKVHLSNQIEIKDKERVIYQDTVNKIDGIAEYILNIVVNMKNNELQESYSQKIVRYLQIGWENGKEFVKWVTHKISSALY